jgi:hypothetical protein
MGTAIRAALVGLLVRAIDVAALTAALAAVMPARASINFEQVVSHALDREVAANVARGGFAQTRPEVLVLGNPQQDAR